MLSQRPLNDKPAGAEKYDNGALTEDQQVKLNQKKIQQRIDNEKYLRQHPEISLLVKDFFKEAYLHKPNDVKEFAADYFTDPNLRQKVNNLLNQNDKKTDVNKMIQQMKTKDLLKPNNKR